MQISSKLLNIQQLEILRKSMAKQSGSIDFQLSFTTAFGTITGDFANPEIEIREDTTLEALLQQAQDHSIGHFYLLSHLKTLYINEVTDESDPIELIGDGSVIVLENVSIFRDNILQPVMTYDIYYLHTDAVIGFSLIPRPAEDEPHTQIGNFQQL